MDVKAIRTEEDYDKALGRIDALLDAEISTPEGDELDVLTTLVEAYEQEAFPIDLPDPIEFIKNIMEFLGVEQNELASILNSRPRASEILNRRRPLTLDHIRKITVAWNVPALPLINKYELRKKSA